MTFLDLEAIIYFTINGYFLMIYPTSQFRIEYKILIY